MKLQFDANQEFQLQAIQSVVDLFDGQSPAPVASAAANAAAPNHLALPESAILANLRAVQERNRISPDGELRCIVEQIETAAGPKEARFYNFAIEMETGTGKTYVYLRTALDLYRRYGWRKYIIVVPSIAIREGVLKTLAVTLGHFREVYDNLPYRFAVYDSANISQVQTFARAHSVEIMVMTLAAFNKAANVIRQSTDRLQGETPIHFVQAARPILILDEPQNMESERSIASLAALDPLFALRYSATHRNPYNLVYRLTPFEAYRQGLVKRIEVAAVTQEHDEAQPYIRVEKILAEKRTVTARLTVHALRRDGTIAPQTVIVRPGAALEEIARRPEYRRFTIDEISPGGGFVRFGNGQELAEGGELGADRQAVFEAQIRYTIEEHMRKQARLQAHGLKVLSLFFIDRVDNYAPPDAPIRRIFRQAFDQLKQGYPAWREREAETVQAAYFAQRRTRSGDNILEDSVSGETERDREAYDLIMRDKERLLSLDEPVSFIFSHSALGEGWDNPNVFQICALRNASGERQRRQQVGRGVRLPVNQAGQRVRDENANILTVIANESYERFVASLQGEIADEYRAEIEARYGKPLEGLSEEERAQVIAQYGADILPPPPANARQRQTGTLRKHYTLKPEFKELWQRIRQKTRYRVVIDSDKLVGDVVVALAGVVVTKPRVAVTKAALQVGADDAFVPLQMSGGRTLVDLVGRYPLPNLLDLMANLLQFTTPPVRLTRRTLLRILQEAPPLARQAMVDNPAEFAAKAVEKIKDRLADQLIDGIQYEKIDDWYEMTQFEADIEGWQDNFVSSLRPDGSEGSSLYDAVPIESEPEREFVRKLEQRLDVKLYVKLPDWFIVQTPIGDYNPDWAIVMENPKPGGELLLYLVRETKSTLRRADWRLDEQRKVTCGERHFQDTLGVNYAVVSDAGQLP